MCQLIFHLMYCHIKLPVTQEGRSDRSEVRPVGFESFGSGLLQCKILLVGQPVIMVLSNVLVEIGNIIHKFFLESGF